jgi:hypothetical protein
MELATLDGRKSLLQFKWKGDAIEVESDGKQIAKGSRPDIVKLYPDLADYIQQGVDIQIADFSSPDGRWLGILHQRLPSHEHGEIAWQIFRLNGSDRNFFKSGTVKDIAFEDLGIFFLERSPTLVVHDDECTLSLFNLNDGSKLGQISSAFSKMIRVKQIADDLIALDSTDLYSEAESVQIFSFPDLNQGPWFIQWHDNGMDDLSTPGKEDVPAKDDLARAALRRPAPLVANIGKLEIAEEGRILVVRPSDEAAVTLLIPPWGKRLRELFVSK